MDEIIIIIDVIHVKVLITRKGKHLTASIPGKNMKPLIIMFDGFHLVWLLVRYNVMSVIMELGRYTNNRVS